jgi:hypothetical protein
LHISILLKLVGKTLSPIFLLSLFFSQFLKSRNPKSLNSCPP